MSMLARYKKSDSSFLELVKLIESSTDEKRANLMKMVREEDPAFAAKVEARVLVFDDVKKMDEGIIAEVVSRNSPKVLAFLLLSEKDDENFIKVVEKSLGKLFSEVKAEKEALEGLENLAAKRGGMQRKFVAEARKAAEEGVIRLPVKEGALPPAGMSVEPTSGSAPMAQGAAAPANSGLEASAVLSNSCPPIASFGLEVPPPGMRGERFDEYIKKKLGA